jgi:predicted helicase
MGVKTNRDDWVCDFHPGYLGSKVCYLVSEYEQERLRLRGMVTKANVSDFISYRIKWTRKLKKLIVADKELSYSKAKIKASLYRPFAVMETYFDEPLNEDQYQLHSVPLDRNNTLILLSGYPSQKPFQCMATNKLFHHDTLDKTNCVSLSRLDKKGKRLDNITDWALAEFRAHYEGAKNPSPLGGQGVPAKAGTDEGAVPSPGAARRPLPHGDRVITKNAIFHYVYGVLHDPDYREKYALNLKREFPRIPYYPDFWKWAGWGESLMKLHIGYETIEPWPLARIDAPDKKSSRAGLPPKALLRANKEAGNIQLDTETQLTGIPPEAWEYRLGNRSALEWILDQYKEKTPKDPTIREKFNTYRFADNKEKVIDLLKRVTRVSVETMKIIEAMRAGKR